MNKKERRKLIARRVAAKKMSVKMREAWQRRKQQGSLRSDPDDDAGLPETDTALDELPDSLVG